MSFIDYQHAERISKWCEKHPEESEAYFREHQELSQLFQNHKINFDEFQKRSFELKEKYHFLAEAGQ